MVYVGFNYFLNFTLPPPYLNVETRKLTWEPPENHFWKKQNHLNQTFILGLPAVSWGVYIEALQREELLMKVMWIHRQVVQLFFFQNQAIKCDTVDEPAGMYKSL